MTDRTQPNSDELLSELTDSLKPQGELRPLCLQAASHIASLKARIAELEANERAYEEIIGHKTYREVAGRIKELEGALRLAEDVLSRAPFSTGIWPNGMHPNAGIEKIRDALEPKHD